MSVARYKATRIAHADRIFNDSPSEKVAAIYNQVGKDYVAYADGNPRQLFSFDGVHGCADRQIWLALLRKLSDLRASGATSVNLLRCRLWSGDVAAPDGRVCA